MIYKIEDFFTDWKRETDCTAKVLANLTDESLHVKASEGSRELGFIAWHIVLTISEMMNKTDLKVDGPPEDAPMPATAKEILDAYKKASDSMVSEVKNKWNDSMLNDVLELYGQKWKRWELFDGLVKHEIHHRGQLTAMMRLAGLKVPGVYGPAKEEWVQYGMEAHP